MEQVTLTRVKFCALCHTTAAKRGSLCHTCADDIDRQMIDDNAVPNFETCRECGGELRRGHCFDCLERGAQYGPAEIAS